MILTPQAEQNDRFLIDIAVILLPVRSVGIIEDSKPKNMQAFEGEKRMAEYHILVNQDWRSFLRPGVQRQGCMLF